MQDARAIRYRSKNQLSRRQFLKHSISVTASLALLGSFGTGSSLAQNSSPIMRTIPSTGRQIPAIGLGSSATFSQVAREEDIEAVRGVLSTLHRLGGRVFDTAPGYGASEEVAGEVAQSLGIEDELFWATKLNVARNGPADPATAREQLEASFQRVGKSTIDLVQVHNMGDPDVQLGILQEYKDEGRIQHIGITTTRESQYAELMEVMRQYPLDFIGIDYAVDNRNVEQEVLPLAQAQGIAVLAYAPFGRTRLWSRVGERPVPDYAAEFDAHTWGQFFLKFVISHPAITAATPSTSRPGNMEDNIGAMLGRLPDEAMRRRMIATVDELPMV